MTNLADGFAYVYEIADQNLQKAVTEANLVRAARAERKEGLKVMFALLAVLLIGVVGVGYALWRKYFRKMKPVMFPVTIPRKRLAAPYSGGGDVLLKYKRSGQTSAPEKK